MNNFKLDIENMRSYGEKVEVTYHCRVMARLLLR